MKGEQFWLPGLKPEKGPTVPKDKPPIGSEEDYMDPADFVNDKNMSIEEEPPEPVEKTVINFTTPSDDDKSDDAAEMARLIESTRFKSRYTRPTSQPIRKKRA